MQYLFLSGLEICIASDSFLRRGRVLCCFYSRVFTILFQIVVCRANYSGWIHSSPLNLLLCLKSLLDLLFGVQVCVPVPSGLVVLFLNIVK